MSKKVHCGYVEILNMKPIMTSLCNHLQTAATMQKSDLGARIPKR